MSQYIHHRHIRYSKHLDFLFFIILLHFNVLKSLLTLCKKTIPCTSCNRDSHSQLLWHSVKDSRWESLSCHLHASEHLPTNQNIRGGFADQTEPWEEIKETVGSGSSWAGGGVFGRKGILLVRTRAEQVRAPPSLRPCLLLFCCIQTHTAPPVTLSLGLRTSRVLPSTLSTLHPFSYKANCFAAQQFLFFFYHKLLFVLLQAFNLIVNFIVYCCLPDIKLESFLKVPRVFFLLLKTVHGLLSKYTIFLPFSRSSSSVLICAVSVSSNICHFWTDK